MSTVRVATFNCENLFARFKFKSNVSPQKATADGFTVNELAFEFLKPVEKKLTGQVVKRAKADVIALQEVENLDVLKRFRSEQLGGAKAYPHAILIDGNDPRKIDVALLSKFPLTRIRTWQHLRKGASEIFSRDCLEVDVDVAGKTLTLYVNHFKSMLDKNDPANGRKNTKAKRVAQSKQVKELVTERFGSAPGDHPFILLGDLNDYLGPGTGINDLVGWNEVENVVARLPKAEQWTHFWDTKKSLGDERYKQIDYLLLSRSLAAASSGMPEIIRDGLCLNADRYTGHRFDGIGKSTPAASDHCAVVIEVEV